MLGDNVFEIKRDKIENVGFSVRTCNCLIKAGYTYVDEIVNISKYDLYKIEGMGNKSVKEVVDYINDFFPNDINTNCNLASEEMAKLNNINDMFMKFVKFFPVDAYGFSVRAKNVLSSINAIYFYDIYQADILNIKNAGLKTLNEINEATESIKRDFIEFMLNDKKLPEKYGTLKISDFPEIISNVYCQNITLMEAYKLFCKNKNNLTFDSQEDYFLCKFFMKLLNGCVESLSEKIKNRFDRDKIDEKVIDIYVSRGKGVILENIGKKYGITRERIRQKESNYTKKIKKIYDDLKLKCLFISKNILRSTDVIKEIEEFYYIFWIKLDDLDDDFLKIKLKNELIMVKKDYYYECAKFVSNILKKINENGAIEYSSIDNNYDKTVLLALFEKNDIKKYGSYLMHKSSKRKIVENYLKLKCIIDISSFEKLQNVIKELNINFELEIDSERNLKSYLEDCAYSIGNGQYVPFSDYPKIDNDIMKEISDYIENNKTVKSSTLYDKYKNAISDMHSPTHLYLFLKRKYPNKFSYGGANLTISKIGFVTSTASTVYNYIKESEEPVDRIDIMHYANIDGTALANIEKQNKDIFKFKNNKYYLRSKLVRTDEITKYINEYINQSLSKNKIYIRDVFIYLYKKDKGLLDDNYMNSSDDLFSVINVLTIKELDNYEYDKNTNQYVIKSIEMDMFGDEI